MAANITEAETTYDAPDGVSLPRLDELSQVAGTRVPDADQLDDEYYDTADLRLVKAGITLRRRGGPDAGWLLRLPLSPHAHRDIRLPLDGADRRVPDTLAWLVLAAARGEPVRPVAQMTVLRQRVILLGSSGESLAEVASDDVRARSMGDTMTATRWHEVDVELTGGDQALLAAADKALRHEGLRPAHRGAKLERALGVGPAWPGSVKLTPSSPAGQVVQAHLRSQAQTLKALDPLVRRDEPDAVHQMRVTARRLRADLQAFGQVIPRWRSAWLVSELRWLGGVLGAPRDLEVLSGRLLDCLAAYPAELVLGPVQARVRAHFAPRRAAARGALLQALESQRYFALLDELDRLTSEPPSGPAADQAARDVLPAAVSHAYRRTSQGMARALEAPPGTAQDVALHQARIAAKRARYAAEAVTPAFGDQAWRLARQMRRLQTVLGDHQDTVISRQILREMGIRAHLAGENAFSYGLLYEREACTAGQLRDQAGETWQEASRGRYRHWLG